MAAEQLIELMISQGKITREQLDRQIEDQRVLGPIGLVKETANKLKSAQQIYEEVVLNENALLEDVKTAKINALKDACTNAVYHGFEVGGNQYGMNEHDQANFTQRLVVMVSGDTSQISWKTKNNGVVDLTDAEFRGVIQAAEAHKMAQQVKFWGLEQDVLAAEDKVFVNAVNW